MLNRSVLPLLAVLVLAPTAASAQLRFEPPTNSRLRARPLPLPESRYRIVIADSVRRQTYWQNGWWTGVAIGAVLGTAIAFGNREGYPHTFTEKVKVSIVAGGFIGVPLGVIGGLIGDSFKRPATNGP